MECIASRNNVDNIINQESVGVGRTIKVCALKKNPCRNYFWKKDNEMIMKEKLC